MIYCVIAEFFEKVVIFKITNSHISVEQQKQHPR